MIDKKETKPQDKKIQRKKPLTDSVKPSPAPAQKYVTPITQKEPKGKKKI